MTFNNYPFHLHPGEMPHARLQPELNIVLGGIAEGKTVSCNDIETNRTGVFPFTKYELEMAHLILEKAGKISRDPTVPGGWKICEECIMEDCDKYVNFEPHSFFCDLKTRWEYLIQGRMARAGMITMHSRVHFEVFCLVSVIAYTTIFGPRKKRFSDPVNAELIRYHTGIHYSEYEIKGMIQEALDNYLIEQFPFDKSRYRVSKEFLLRSEGTTTLLVVPIENFQTRWADIIKNRMLCKEFDWIENPIELPIDEFVVISTLHKMLLKNPLVSSVTELDLYEHEHLLLSQHESGLFNKPEPNGHSKIEQWRLLELGSVWGLSETPDLIIEKLCKQGFIHRDAENNLHIAPEYILDFYNTKTLLIVPDGNAVDDNFYDHIHVLNSSEKLQ